MEKQALTPREQEVLHLVIQAKSNVEMSNALYISQISIEKHLSSLYRKAGVKNPQELIVNYYRFK